MGHPANADRWHAPLAVAIVTTLLLTACNDEPLPSPAGPSTPEPPAPPPSPSPPSDYVGAVYAGTNNYGPAGNWVVAFGRRSDGTLVPLDFFETGGNGRPGTSWEPPRLNPLIAEDSMIAVNDRFLLVVNAGSNSVTSLRINADFSLAIADIETTSGTAPVSLAYGNGVVYVANADQDGVFNGPSDQSGSISAMRLDETTGALTSIAGFSLPLHGRPADLEVTADGRYLLISSLNAGSPLLPQPTAAEIATFRILPDGRLASLPAGTGMSTAVNNTSGRNLPNATGIETWTVSGRQFVIAAEARTASPAGMPAPDFGALQTGSVSTWEVAADGALLPRSQDFLLGASYTAGPTQAGFLAYSPVYSTFWVASSAGAQISGYGLHPDGTIALGEAVASGIPADPSAASPLADADGFVDLAISADGRWLYQLAGLKGRVDVYEIDTLVGYNISLRQQVTTGLLPPDNLQGLVSVEAAGR